MDVNEDASKTTKTDKENATCSKPAGMVNGQKENKEDEIGKCECYVNKQKTKFIFVASNLAVETESGLYNYKLAMEIKDRGNQNVKLGNYTKAIEDYTEAINILPNNAIFYSNRALCFLKMERWA